MRTGHGLIGRHWIAALAAALLCSTSVYASPLQVDLSGFQQSEGIRATSIGGAVEVEWRGADNQRLRIRLDGSEDGPVIRELSIMDASGAWQRVLTDVRVEYSVVEGYRRISNQQLEPLNELDVEITDEIIDRYRWDVFWDAPLDTRPVENDGTGFVRNPPPAEGIASQPGLPRNPEEIRRGSMHLSAASVAVTGGDGSVRLSFPGVQLGTFSGELVLAMYEGTNLVQTEVVAATQAQAVAFKYDAGIGGLASGDAVRVVWNDTANLPQSTGFPASRPSNSERSLVRAANRVLAVETGTGSVAAFPPPHTWYWAREVEVNLGNNYFRKDADGTLAIGVGQAERELEQFAANWSLYSAPPGSVQHMRAFFYPTLGTGQAAISEALAFTNGDVYPVVAGHMRMGTHYHIDAGRQWLENGLDFRIDDFDALRGAGLDIISLTERPRRQTQLQELDAAFRGARLHSDSSFLILPNTENSFLLGGHWDMLYSRPTFFMPLSQARTADQALVYDDPTFGRVYQLGSEDDVMEMVQAEDMLIYMPHPRTKGSTGYPDAIRDEPRFRDDRYRGAGWRWGMGLDLSDVRMSGLRALPLLDEMNNWAAQGGYRPKYLQAITETYFKGPGDDIYGSGPMQYIRLASLPTDGDYSPIIDAMSAGDYFMSTGEVRFENHGVKSTGEAGSYEAEISWTFPLNFVEVVWGDGTQTHAVSVPATQYGAFGRRVFNVPVDLSTARWVRFAAWDIAGNGAFTNPVALDGR